MKLSDAYKTEIENPTVKVFLDIDGNLTDHYIEVYTLESLKGINAQNRIRGRMYSAAMAGEMVIIDSEVVEGQKEVTDKYSDINNRFIVELIKGWSFEDELTEDLAYAWLTMNPDVATQIDLELKKHSESLDAKKKP